MTQFLNSYLQKIKDRGNVELAESIYKTAQEVGDSHIKTFSFSDHEIGLLFGNVQSGKTGQVFGIISRATDLGFPVFVLLTTDNVVLQQQTLDRVKADLDGYCICGENDSRIFTENNLVDPAIIVLKKNARVLKLWANVLNSTGFMLGNPLFIIDDEADAASLNTLINKNSQSSINKYLESIIRAASSSIYLQVTGTPQALFLQTQISGWHPLFTYYFQPGSSYLGGDFFFPHQKPDCIIYNDTLSDPTLSVVIRHLAVSSQIIASGGKVSNCLFHPSVRQAVHEKYAKEVQKDLQWCKDHFADDFQHLLQKEYNELTPNKSEKVSYNSLLSTAKDLLYNEKIKILVMNGKSEIDNSDYESGCNFVIGGNTLGRGVTFPSLHTIYYTRTSKKPQADTMWQHSRMFGYDRDPDMMRVFIDGRLYKLFADINATNNSIISQVEKGIENIKIHYPDSLNPTRKNVLDNKRLVLISGGTNYYPNDPDNDSIETISKIMEPFKSEEPYYQVSLRLIRDLLAHIIPSPDFKLTTFISVIDAMLSEKAADQGILIARRDRNVAQGTGALLSSNDWDLVSQFNSKVVLTMYQVTGTKGWKGKPMWVPNIKLPEGNVYYDVDEN